MSYEIESGIEIPQDANTSGYPKYPFKNMDIGQSFLVPDDDASAHTKVRSAASGYAKRHDKRFFTQRVNGGIRVWRTA